MADGHNEVANEQALYSVAVLTEGEFTSGWIEWEFLESFIYPEQCVL